jgi:hyaluronoglucosaminidase
MDRYYGYIEGYYGKLLSWDERRDICVCMERLSLNTYVYAPKEDPYHRVQWKTPYPSDWMETFRRFIKDAAKKNILVVPSLSPGLSFDYCNDADYNALLNKMSLFADIGARTVALLMDDIPNELPRQCRQSFSSLGEAHGKLLSRLQKDLKKRSSRLSVWFCPTVYTDQAAKEGVEKSPYLADLAVSMPDAVYVLWTGPGVISKQLDKKGISPVSGMFNGNVVIWDNLYANDYCPHRLFTGSYRGRNADVHEVTRGILLNPTGMPVTDMFLLALLSGFVNNVPTAKAWKQAVEQTSIAREFLSISPFFDLPFSAALHLKGTLSKSKMYRKALHRLIWDWKSPLQREWYPFLFMLDTDLALLEGKTDAPEFTKLVLKKYPPVLSTIIIDKKATR